MPRQKNLDGFSLIPYADGKFLAWDYTCRYTMADNYKVHAAVEADYAAIKFGYSEKATKFEKIFHRKFDITD